MNIWNFFMEYFSWGYLSSFGSTSAQYERKTKMWTSTLLSTNHRTAEQLKFQFCERNVDGLKFVEQLYGSATEGIQMILTYKYNSNARSLLQFDGKFQNKTLHYINNIPSWKYWIYFWPKVRGTSFSIYLYRTPRIAYLAGM